MNNQQKKELFNNIAIAMGTPDIKVASQAYYAIAKYIVRETNRVGSLKLPDLGEFRLVRIKSRLSNIPGSKEKKMVPASWMMRFSPDYKVKGYINRGE